MLRDSSDGTFEKMRSLNQELTFREAERFFRDRKVEFGIGQRRTLGLIGEDGLFTNLALLLSDQCPYTLKLAVFEGTVKAVFRERREIGGSVLAQVREAFEYLDKWNRTRAEIRGLDRIDRRDYPPDSVREVLLNAIIHRDYALQGACLVSLFDDRLEVLGSGGLPYGVAMSDILLGLSVPRNPVLAATFYRLRLVEAYGTGIPKIRGEYANDPRQPVFEASDHAFKTVIWNRNAYGIAEGNDNGRNVQPVSIEDRERDVLSALRKAGVLTRADVERLCGVSVATAARTLAALTKKGLVVKTGRGPVTRYSLANPSSAS
jgi:ATP-dependent DNA helicase RecG